MQTINTQAARELFKTLDAVHEATRENTTLAKFLLHVGAAGGREVGFEELENALGITKSQVSRATRLLCRLSHRGKEGFDYLNVSFDITNTRAKVVRLNDKGREAVLTMLGESPASGQ